jgi:hypothetical protein
MIFDVLERGSEVRVCDKYRIQKIPLGRIEEWPVTRLASEDFVIDSLWVSILEWGRANRVMVILKIISYPFTKSQMSTPKDQTSTMKL